MRLIYECPEHGVIATRETRDTLMRRLEGDLGCAENCRKCLKRTENNYTPAIDLTE